MNRFGICNQFGIFRHRPHKVRTIRLHNQAFFLHCICDFSKRKNKIGTTIRQNMDAHTIFRVTFKFPIVVNIGSKQMRRLIFCIHGSILYANIAKINSNQRCVRLPLPFEAIQGQFLREIYLCLPFRQPYPNRYIAAPFLSL